MNDQDWASSVVERSIARGIDHFFLAPGSRCTPLTLAVARHEQAYVIQHFDERGLAYAALGFGKSSKRPGVFICTSGTAVANAFPAVIEAATEGVPMLLFTADRPNELRGTGANQTIDQREIFGGYPRLFLHMPVPEDLASEAESQTQLQRSLEHCFRESKSGPVHVNWMFREPFSLEASGSSDVSPAAAKDDPDLDLSNQGSVEITGNTLIALGNCTPDEAREARGLAEKFSCPILSDVTSGLRTGSFELPTEFTLPRPDTILHLGGRVVSKSWLAWCNSLRESGTNFVHLTSTGQAFNPNRLPQKKIQMPLCDLVSKLEMPGSSGEFFQAWHSAAIQRDEVIRRQLSKSILLTEPAVAFHLYQACPVSHGLFVGNSMPIRDMDWFGVSENSEVRFVEANRGASGIDGLIATATGYSIGLQRPTTLVLGDLSALHDLNSLALVSKAPFPLVIVIINNQSGHIFDRLPIRNSQEFEQFFATPHNFEFENAAKMFGLSYFQIGEMEEFKSRYQESVSSGKSVVLELLTDRQRNIEARQQLQKEIRQWDPS